MSDDRNLLDDISKTFRDRRQQIQSELDDLDRKEDAIRKALNGSIDKRSIAPAKPKRDLSVPDHVYEDVLRYLSEHPDSRQTDIAEALNINSGLVSMAVRIALDKKEAKTNKPGRGAKYQTTVAYRETIVHAGEGVRKGRKTK